MDNKPIGDEPVVVLEVKDESPQQSERRNPRKRFIQSTIFPHKPQVIENKVHAEENGTNQVQAVDFESPGSMKKKRGRPKSKKPTPDKAPDTGKEVAVRIDDETSPLAGKRSNRRLKDKGASPCKDLTLNGSKGACRRRIMTNCTSGTAEDTCSQSEEAAAPVVDLRLEAKLAAEENARLFAGKQTHPFFSSRKMGKKVQETTEVPEPQSKSCLAMQEDKAITCPPFHIFEKLQDDVALDWRDWVFCHNTLLTRCCGPQTASSSVFEDYVKPLSFNDFLSVPSCVGASPPEDAISLDKSSNQIHTSAMSLVASLTSANLQVQERNKEDISLGCAGSIIDLIDESPNGGFEERMTSYSDESGSQPESNLWTMKYQPEKASEICGNGDSVRFLNEWLQCWRERSFRTNKASNHDNNLINLDSDYSAEEDDSDAESMDEEGLKNILLVTGAIGSGKSAAIYACAKEQGFEVIEVSASDWRNGAHIKQKFGEAMESHRFTKCSLEDLRMRNSLEFPSVHIGDSSSPLDIDVVELTPESNLDEAEVVELGYTNVVHKGSLTACSRGANKTLILFEDVDTIFDEDRGFISTIQQLAKTAKRPMILTSNCKDPVLPDQLDRVEVSFELPSRKELLTYLYKICDAEKADIPTVFIDRLIGCCQNDIRKTIMLIQFWCQGKSVKKDRGLWSSYYPVQVDLDAWHWVLPKVIPWGFPCQLSELLEKEITKSLTMAKQRASLLDVVIEEEEMQDVVETDCRKETDSIVAKKEAMLSRNGCFHDDSNVFATQCSGVSEFSNSSGSPVAFTRQRGKRKLTTVFSSLSGDECTDNIQATSNILPNDLDFEVLPSSSDICIPHTIGTQDYLNLSNAQLHHYDEHKMERELCKYSETESHQHTCETYRSLDVSCVPESSYVAETDFHVGLEFPSNTVFCDDASVNLMAISSCGKELVEGLSIVGARDTDEFLDPYKNSETILSTGHNIDANSVREDEEEVGDSHNEHEETARSGFQVMDECSRADINMASTSFKDESCFMGNNPVHEAWRKFRYCHADLKSHITSQQKEAAHVVKLLSGMADLVSEADLMLGCCQHLIRDTVEPLIIPSVEANAFCWSETQVEMTSTLMQHGLCLLTKEASEKGSNLGLKNRVDLASEMLAFTTNTTELGKLITNNINPSPISCIGRGLENDPPRSIVSSQREVQECLNNTIQALVPPRLYSTMKGLAYHEYVSSLGMISKLEASRLSENIDKPRNRRRGRVARHYLSTELTPEDVSLLAQYSCYGKVSVESTDAKRD